MQKGSLGLASGLSGEENLDVLYECNSLGEEERKYNVQNNQTDEDKDGTSVMTKWRHLR